jgi:hypothetical protein
MRYGRGCLPAVVFAIFVALPATATAGIKPNPVGQLDCNGFSPIQVELHITAACADPRGLRTRRFYDNGWYIGHDEPAIRLISNAPGSSSDMTFVERLGRDPAQAPTVAHPGSDVTHYFELSPAPWFSTSLCDPNSFPGRPCKPESDSNAPTANNPGGGAAFLELQFYPPGYAPFADNLSCDNQHWCSALNVDSLECNTSTGGDCNNNCVEPVNFAFIQTNGVPTGPPGPQLSNLDTVTPNAHTLMMNPGDVIVVHILDAPLPGGGRALETSEKDLTTGQEGFMIASAANGFMTTSRKDCSGTPFNFQPEYSSAAPANILPWGAGPYNVDTEFEIGHFEPCSSLTDPQQLTIGSLSDTFWSRCHGPYEQGNENADLEPNDAPCYPAGDTHGGTAAPNEVTGCDVFFNAIGDLEYDGSPYRADWPTSTTPGTFPAAFEQIATSRGRTYPRVQFETDLAATEAGCNLTNGEGCVVPPNGPGHFYPYWTQARTELGCTWQFGQVRNGNTFGGDAQYGAVGPNTLGAFVGPIIRNPNCAAS